MSKLYSIDRLKHTLALFPLLLILTGCIEESNSSSLGGQEKQKQESSLIATQALTMVDYAEVLKEYVNSSGRVDYKRLKNNRQKLDKFNAIIGSVAPANYESWTDEDKIAFLINAYNSLTLEAIIDNYPTESIRDISGVWDRRKFKVVGREMTLDAIEHEILRKEFNEPRIHMALVCASIGCPKLNTEPFTGENLNTQLDEQTKAFLAIPDNFRIDRSSKQVYVSSIFKWFGEDFEKSYGQKENIVNLNGKETAFINFISQYLMPTEKEYLLRGGYGVSYLDYDWSLNDKK
jgi:ribosomal protein S18